MLYLKDLPSAIFQGVQELWRCSRLRESSACSFNLRSYRKIEGDSTVPGLIPVSELHLTWTKGKVFFVSQR